MEPTVPGLSTGAIAGIITAAGTLLTVLGGGVAWLMNHFAARADKRDANFVVKFDDALKAQDVRHANDMKAIVEQLGKTVNQLVMDREKDREERTRSQQVVESQFVNGQQVAVKTVEAIERMGSRLSENTQTTATLASVTANLDRQFSSIASRLDETVRDVIAIKKKVFGDHGEDPPKPERRPRGG